MVRMSRGIRASTDAMTIAAAAAYCACEIPIAAQRFAEMGAWGVTFHIEVAKDPAETARMLRSMGVRPVRISKYCLGVALLHPDTAANPWNRLLNRQFAWQRTAEATPGGAHGPAPAP